MSLKTRQLSEGYKLVYDDEESDPAIAWLYYQGRDAAIWCTRADGSVFMASSNERGRRLQREAETALAELRRDAGNA